MDRLEGVNSEVPQEAPSKALTGVAALRTHLTLAAGLGLCVAAFWFEIGRAEGGNSLSWAYVFEWPLLGVFGVYMWWNVLHPERKKGRRPRVQKPLVAPEYAGMLAAWQEHQRELVASQEAASLESSEPSEESKGPE